MPPASQPRSSPLRTMLGYAVMLGAAAVAYWLIRMHGLGLVPPEPAAGQLPFGPAGGATHFDALMHVLLALVVVIVVARGVGSLFAYFAQPPVVGEIIAGILLGPSVLGRFAPDAQAFLLPKEVAPFLGVLSNVGVPTFGEVANPDGGVGGFAGWRGAFGQGGPEGQPSRLRGRPRRSLRRGPSGARDDTTLPGNLRGSRR